MPNLHLRRFQRSTFVPAHDGCTRELRKARTSGGSATSAFASERSSGVLRYVPVKIKCTPERMACKECGAAISHEGSQHEHVENMRKRYENESPLAPESERAGPALPSFEENERLQAALDRLRPSGQLERTLACGSCRRWEEGVDRSRRNFGTLIRDLGLAPGSEVDGIEHDTKQVRGNETQLRRS
jgi:hypothetical protein